MNDKRDFVLIRQRAGGFQSFVGVRVNGVRGDGGSNQRIVLEMSDEFFGIGEGFGGSFRVSDGKSDNGFSENAADAGLLCGLGHHFLEVVHIGEGGGAGEQHYEGCEAGAPADEIGRNVFGFGGYDVVLQPVLQFQIVGNAAEKRHRRVSVGVDQARREDGVAGVEAVLRLPGTIEIGARAGGDDTFAEYGHCAVIDDAAVGAHGDEVAGGDDEVAGSGGQRRGGGQQSEQEATRNEASKALGKSVPSRRYSVLPLRLASAISTSPQNSQRIWRQAPHGGVRVSVSATTAMRVKRRAPSEMALKMATRSAQTVSP